MSDVLFPASVIGSMPRSAFVRDLIADEPVDPDAMDAAVAYIVRLQERAGLDVVNDGEYGKSNFTNYVRERIGGL